MGVVWLSWLGTKIRIRIFFLDTWDENLDQWYLVGRGSVLALQKKTGLAFLGNEGLNLMTSLEEVFGFRAT